MGCVLGAWGVFWVSRGVLGVLEGVLGLWELSGSVFYSILININGALIKALTFSKRREGPRCPKYQNVPTLRSFWPIGKPREMFQSWDIRVYFIAVPNDHTVDTATDWLKWSKAIYKWMGWDLWTYPKSTYGANNPAAHRKSTSKGCFVNIYISHFKSAG